MRDTSDLPEFTAAGRATLGDVLLTIRFASGQVATVIEPRDCGLFRTGLARRDDGLMRCVFLDRNGTPHSDKWLLS